MRAGLRLLLLLTLLLSFAEPAHAINYLVSYNANENQHQTGVTSGSLPTTVSYASGATITVSANDGNLVRKGFTFEGWNTQSNGSGTTYLPGNTFILGAANVVLYAKWSIPISARLIGSGGSIVSITDPNTVPGASNCTGGSIRGITSDGTNVFYRSSSATTYLCKVDMSGVVVQAINIGSSLSAIPIDSIDLTYSNGCIFLRSNGTSSTTINCIDISDWTVNSKTLPVALPAGGGWLTGNIIDFPDGRIGSVSAPTSSPGTLGCSGTMYCKTLKLFNVIGTGKNVTFTFSEDIILADDVAGWPNDDHGIATDGTYLYEIMFASGYKVWALQSGTLSYLVFNGSGSGTCTASSGVSGSLCPINSPTAGAAVTSNATFLGRNHTATRYLMGDYSNPKFYISDAATPPAGPGTLITESTFSAFGLAGGVTTVAYRGTIQINATVNIQSRVTFKVNVVPIVGCRNKLTSGSSPNITATCTWKTSKHGEQLLSATALPVISGTGSTTSPVKIMVSTRTGKR
jgi:uncharacterized repeat protein (TIGR02543 family)